MKKRKLAILVPAHNEQTVIGSTLKSLLEVAPAADIFVVDDGSIDKTSANARKFTKNVLTLSPNVGKATAMNTCIEHFKLVEKYEYLLPMDADTNITKPFLEASLPILEADRKKKIMVVVGKVMGKPSNWITTYRLWEYEVAQAIHKSAQSITGSIIVCPGCSTIYRTEIFKSLKIPVGTLTEDMDFTFQIHRQKLGKIVYINDAVVITQDPQTLKDFLKQIDRWYTGFWQCVQKNNVPWGGQMLDAELAMLASEALFNGLLVVALIFLIPLALWRFPSLLLLPFLFDLLIFLIPTMIFTAIRQKCWPIFLYIPHFYFARFAACAIFLKSFVKVVLALDLKMSWFKAKRYKVA